MYGLHGDIQAAFYLRGIKAITGEAHSWRWIVQETAPPYALSVCTLSRFGMELAERKVELAINLWRKCIETDTWPAYSKEVYEINPPAWQETEQLSRELNAEDPDAVKLAIEMGRPL